MKLISTALAFLSLSLAVSASTDRIVKRATRFFEASKSKPIPDGCAKDRPLENYRRCGKNLTSGTKKEVKAAASQLKSKYPTIKVASDMGDFFDYEGLEDKADAYVIEYGTGCEGKTGICLYYRITNSDNREAMTELTKRKKEHTAAHPKHKHTHAPLSTTTGL